MYRLSDAEIALMINDLESLNRLHEGKFQRDGKPEFSLEGSGYYKALVELRERRVVSPNVAAKLVDAKS